MRIEREVRHPQNGVHWGADFVADIGEKLAFRPAGCLRRVFGLPQLFFDSFEIGDVDARAGKSDWFPRAIPHGDSARQNPSPRAIAVERPELHLIFGCFASEISPQRLLNSLPIVGVNTLRHGGVIAGQVPRWGVAELLHDVDAVY